MDLPISIDDIKKMVINHQINNNFPYLNDANVMYHVIKEDLTLTNLINYEVGARVCLLLSQDKEISLPLKKTLFYHLIDYCKNISNELLNLIDNEDYYYQLASKSFYVYLKLYEKNHPYKDIEEQLFFDEYQHQYIYSTEYPISYAKKSSEVLLKTLKASKLNIYYISFFDNEAFSDEVLNYLENNIDLDIINLPQMYRTSKMKLLKLKKDFNFLFLLKEDDLSKEILDYLQSINIDIKLIDKYIKENNSYPNCLYNPDFILILLKNDIDNIKYFKGENFNQQLLDYLNQNNYLYREYDNSILLQDKEIFNRFINNQKIDIILNNNINLEDWQIDVVINKIISDNLDYTNITNKYLLHSKRFIKKLVDYYQISNPYHLKDEYVVLNLALCLDKLSLVFSNDEIRIIIREIIENDYHIDMIGILNNIDVFNLKDIYNKLYQKENKFNNKFNFYYFIKVMDYFANHLDLVNELNKEMINDEVIDNLAVVINCNDNVNYQELKDYPKIFRKRIMESDLSNQKKLYQLLVNSDKESVKDALNNTLNIPQLLYLQLEFSKSSLPYQLLESYIDMVNLLKKIYRNEVDNKKLLENMLSKGFPNPLFDLLVMKENVLRLFAIMYQKLGIDKDKLRQKGKSDIINGKEVFDITGEKFTVYLHTENFNNQDDFTNASELEHNNNYKNYLCTSFANEISYDDLNRTGMLVYEFKNPNSLIAFGNRDIFIDYTKKPLFKSDSCYVNPIDMAFLNKVGYTDTEFDFLRVDDDNKVLLSSFVVAQSREEAVLKTQASDHVIIFDKNKHLESLKHEFLSLCDNVDSLSYKELYYLIGLSSKFLLSSDVIESIGKRVMMLEEKEQIIIQNALENYGISVKLSRKVK